MVDIIKRSGLLIPRTHEHKEWYINVKEKLTRTCQSYQTSTIETQEFYIESEKFMLIPRYFPLDDYITSINIKNNMHVGEDINIEHNITPRSETQKLVIDYMLKNDRGTIQLAPGVGKTVISIYVICERKKKSIILVHRDALVDQWQDRILQFTDIKKENITRLTSANFEDELKKSIIITTTQTFTSLLKRKREEFLISLDKANIGIFIGDEVHTTVGAPTFSTCSMHIPSKVTFGLSATPFRFDGNEDIIKYHIGPIFEDTDTEGTMPAKVTAVLLDYEIDTPRRYKYIRWEGRFQRSRYLNLMKKSKSYRGVLKGLIGKLGIDRNLICIVERVKLIDEHYDETTFSSKSKFCGTAKADTLEKRISFSTPGKCRDGIDVPWKDCVIITSPIRNIEQLTGRVTRTSPNKKVPIIIDMIDHGCSDIARTFYTRKKFYNKKEWPIQYVFCKDDKMTIIDEQMALDIISGK